MRLDFVVFREPLFFEFGEDEFTVYGDLEAPAAGGDEGVGLDVLLEFVEDFVRQTDGLGFIVSSGAVFDFDFRHR